MLFSLCRFCCVAFVKAAFKPRWLDGIKMQHKLAQAARRQLNAAQVSKGSKGLLNSAQVGKGSIGQLQAAQR
jgi:hypothetical protein